MPTLEIKDFSAGWVPSDSQYKGRKNGLLRMESVELDTNGNLSMSGGTAKIGGFAAAAANAHTIFSRFLGQTHFFFAALTSGAVNRCNFTTGATTGIIAGGSATRAAFCAAFDYVFCFSDTQRVRDDGTTTTAVGITVAAAPTTAVGGGGLLTGTYEWYQVNVFKSGAYMAKSAPSPISVARTLAAQLGTITPDAFPGNATECWIYRRGGDLDVPYRVAVRANAAAFSDNMTDEIALLTGQVMNFLSLPVTSTNIADPILEIVGPVNNRLIFFTKNTIHFSEVNSPDSYTPGQSIAFAGGTSGAEFFQWAKKLSGNVIIIGTSKDCYQLTGTFITQGDGTLDVYLHPLGIQNPPIGIDADIYETSVAYMSADGWRLITITGETVSLTDNRIDRIYRGDTCYTLGGVPIYMNGALRYPCAVARNKLWVIVPTIIDNNPVAPFSSRVEVFDFKRKYWRTLPLSSLLLISATEEDATFVFDDTDNFLKQLDSQFVKTLENSSTIKQTITVQTLVFDEGSPFRRKDSYTAKLLISTGGDNCAFSVSTDGGTNFTALGNVNSNGVAEVKVDLTTALATPVKHWMFKLTGQIADFILENISVEYDSRPEQLTHLINLGQHFQGHKTRPRTWPIVIDTLGQNVTFTPSIDGSNVTTSTINTTGKQIHLHKFASDYANAKMIGFKLTGSSSAPFEFYEALPIELVQAFPMVKRYDQVGPLDLFRYGKIRRLRVRLFSDNTANIPYEIFMQDVSIATGNIAAIANVEDSYEISLTKAVVGQNMRIVLGPVSFDFYRYYVQIQLVKEGRDSDNEWLTLPETQ